MSGAEIIGLISGIITLIDASIKIYRASGDTSGLPPSFRDIAARLPVIQDSLVMANQGLDADASSDESHVALKQTLQACSVKATSLCDVFQAVIPAAGVSPTTRRLMMLKAMSKAKTVDQLVGGIMGDLQVLTANYAFRSATRTQIETLVAHMNNRKEKIPRDAHREVVYLRNKGLGTQYVNSGVGNQNIASDAATQINGAIDGGTFNFTSG
ncbi:hypothetical protein QQS21_002829 [Conoideocrella luteorostrata]|uniref:NACHT-NTPase and P-loop NTPases N-terminal domain-containing protein n=1 Tax=Conoideocrella luteorostrata TaxID=1105319 RepID=A0AAJ0CV99_9HYPO|nr:hypothetical protein QQS21_002829 [Conoideocrella luteorostrata]